MSWEFFNFDLTLVLIIAIVRLQLDYIPYNKAARITNIT